MMGVLRKPHDDRHGASINTSFREYDGGTFPSLEGLGALPTNIEVARLMFMMGGAPDLDDLFRDGHTPRELLLGSATRDREMIGRALTRMDLSRVEVINLRNSRLGPDLLATLFEADMPALRAVNLDSCALGDEGLQRLLDTTWFHQLHELSLEHNELTDASLHRLADVIEACELRELNLDANRDMSSRAFAQLLEAACGRTPPLHAFMSIIEGMYSIPAVPERASGLPWPTHLVFG